jgi:hypothetical protein
MCLFALLVITLLCGSANFTGCTPNKVHSISGGCETIEELVMTYEKGHKQSSIAGIRRICFWNMRSNWSKDGPPQLQKAMKQVFRFDIVNVEFVAGPAPDPERGAEVIYEIPDQRKQDAVVGDVHGKLVLVGANGRRLDPSFVVMRYMGRFFIDVSVRVLLDAADSVTTNRDPRYVALEMRKRHDRRKGRGLKLGD